MISQKMAEAIKEIRELREHDERLKREAEDTVDINIHVSKNDADMLMMATCRDNCHDAILDIIAITVKKSVVEVKCQKN